MIATECDKMTQHNMVGNFGEVFNLAIWQIQYHSLY